jgi:hypothetical protein
MNGKVEWKSQKYALVVSDIIGIKKKKTKTKMMRKKTEKLEPAIKCSYQEKNKIGIAYCSKSAFYEIDCPYLSNFTIREKCYSALFKEKTLEFRVCEFDFKKIYDLAQAYNKIKNKEK